MTIIDGPYTLTELGARLEQELAWAVPFVYRLVTRYSLPRVDYYEARSLASNGLVLALQNRRDTGAPWIAWAKIKIRSWVLDWFRSQKMGTRSGSVTTQYIEDMIRRNEDGEELELELTHPAFRVDPDDSDFLGAAMIWGTVCHVLTPRYAQVIMAIYQHDMTHQQIAECLGVTPSRVSQIHRRALDILKPHCV